MPIASILRAHATPLLMQCTFVLSQNFQLVNAVLDET